MNDLVACICEGAAEKAIMKRLLEDDRLIFKREDLLNLDIIMRTSIDNFCRNYLNRDFGTRKIRIIRIIDSINENFRLKPHYALKISGIYTYVTRPEIEMLIIHSEGKYNEYKKSRLKPSDFCKQNIKGYSKSYSFMAQYFDDSEMIINAIRAYDMAHSRLPNELGLSDLLK